MHLACLLRFLRPLVGASALLLSLAIAVPVAHAATTTISIGFDTDNNPATGCVLSVGSVAMTGVEVALDTVAATTVTTGTVGTVTRRICSGGVLGSPATLSTGGWPIGLNAGTAGGDVIETYIPLAELAGSFAARIGAITATDSVIAAAPVILPAAVPPGFVQIPTLSPLALLLLTALVGVTAWLLQRYARSGGRVLFMLCAVALTLTTASVWAIVRDGNPIDWTGIPPLATDPAADAAAGQDLTALFAVVDGANLSLRVDALLARDVATNQPPTVNAGANQTITLPASATLAGSATDDGLPNPPGALTFAWTQVSGPGTTTFGNAASAATTATFSVAGIYVLRLTAGDSVLSAGATVTITVNAGGGPGNQPPTVNAGANQTITLPASATLAGSATDDGLPNPPGALTYAWTQVSGPGTTTFGNAASAATTATFSAAGTYVLQLSASDSVLAARATVTITVNAGGGGANQPPTVIAGANQTITLPATASLAGTATDDGLPVPPGALTTTWSLDSGPGTGVTFGNASAIATNATFSAAGTYLLRLTASDGAASASGTLQVTVIDGAPAFAPIADQTIPLGTRFQLVLIATDANFADTLTYALVAAPAGAALAPSPLIDWTPTAAQLGSNTFTAQVADTNGHTATTTFRVTVVFTNTPPQLAPQNHQTVGIGIPFTRKLTAVDPDAGDVLTFALAAGPSGMTLNGADLSWPTLGRSPGDYPVTVRVTDSSGATDQKSFTVTLQTSASPVAIDDTYQVRVSQTLTVPAAGVLANDLNPSNKAITAVKLSDPALGSLTAFNADGSFTFQAPATPPGTPPGFAEVWRNNHNGQHLRQYPVVGDVNGDGFPDLLLNSQGGPRAVNGQTGATLWNLDYTGYTDCRADFAFTNAPLLADIDDDGKLEYVGSFLACARDATSNSPGANSVDRITAIDTTTGRVKWQSARISASLGDVLAPGTPPSTEDRFQHVIEGAAFVEPHVTRFSAGAPPTILLRKSLRSIDGVYAPITGPLKFPGCRALTGLAADDGRACRATILINGVDGSKQQILTAPNPSGQSQITFDPWREQAPFTVDLDGDGQLEIVSGSDVWKNVGGAWTLLWQSHYEPIQTLAADLDGDGKPEIVHFHAFDKTGGPVNASDSLFKFNGLIIRDALTGAELRRIRLPVYWTAWLTIADVDGDNAPDFVLNSSGRVMAVTADGRIKWSYDIPPGAIGFALDQRSGIANVQVYDLDGDGIPEVVTNSHSEIVVLNGRTGAVKLSYPSAGRHGGSGAHHAVQLVDADNDGHVDIFAQFVSDTAKVDYLLMRGAPNNWLPGPKMHHQVNFMHGDVADNGRVLFNTAVPTSFRNPKQLGTIRDPRLAVGTVFTYAVNDGVANSAPADVFVEIKPTNQPPVITSTPPVALLQRFNPTPPGGLFTHFYQVTALDPDVGDTLTYSLQSAPTAPAYVTMDANGRVRFEPTCGSFGNPCPWGWTFVKVRATDSQGAFAEQSFLVNLTTTAATVPNVVGQLLPAAGAAITAAMLTPVVLNEVFDLAPADTVLAQSPVAGAASVPLGASVNLTVSKGPQPVLMPFLIGQQLSFANTLLTGMGLSSNVTSVFSTTVPAGEITAQSPAFGTPLIPATAPPVALTVSAGGPLPAPIARIELEPGPVLRLAGESIPYRAVAILTDGTGADVSLSAVWSSSVTGVATISTIGVARAITAGSTTISASVGATTGAALLTVAAQALGDTTLPTAAITSPTAGATVIGPVPIVGTASDANLLRYELAIALAGETAFTLIAEGTTAVTNGTLGTLDPTALLNDLYTVRLTVFDRAQNENVATTTVQISGDRKVGLFSLTYQDLSVPAAGIPVAVTRTYDSRDKAMGDFGIGWRQAFNTLRLRTNRVLGTGWVRVVSGPVVTLTATSEHKVSLTLADGRVEEFDLAVSPTSNLGGLGFTNVTGFLPRPGTLGQLQALTSNSLLIVSGGAEDELVDDYSLNTYDPQLYRYTTPDGTQYEIGPRAGVTKVTDANGNSVTFGPGGILHSSGQNVVFTRDTQNRIIAITDPMGNVQTYSYDGNGDLATHTSATGGVSRYKYNRSHGLIEIRDATGNQAVRNEYDASGRLTAVIDANGNRIAIAHNPAAQEELITDRRGNFNRIRYDAQGNILSNEQTVTVAGTLVTAITTATYDAQGNETARVDPDGRRSAVTYSGALPLAQVTDPGGLDLTTSLTFNARNDVTSMTDPIGRAYAFSYDGRGNVSGIATPLTGNATTLTNAQGQPVQGRDALGTTTALTRDSKGNVTREDVRDASSTLLRRMDLAYDTNGNKKSETLYRTVGGALVPFTTQYVYDAANRLTAVTDPGGGIARIEYDAAGRVAARVDPLGRRTAHTYDALGRKTRTTFADGTSENLSYDANNNIASRTDPAGRVTTFTYDELDRLLKTTLPDGTSTQTVYSAGGLVVATVNANGNRTDYTYDAAGRLVTTTLPAVVNGVGGPSVRPQIRRTLDAIGAPTTATDPLGRVISYVYDANGRLTRTNFADGTSVSQTFDVLGRRTSVVNEEGQATNYTYDGLGRLAAVSGLAGSATYTYDEAGNLLTQTDALGRVTRYRYDALNRLLEKQYPGGEIIKLAYDAAGNGVALTDPNGKTTTFAYDALNRLTRKTLPGGTRVDFTYTADGRRSTVTDFRGVTTYSYDSQGRLSGVTHPDGATLAYARDGNGNVLSSASPGATVSYAYDALDRLSSATAPEGQSQYFYDLGGNRVRRTSANGILTDFTFDPRNRPALIAHKTPANAVLRSFANVRSAVGRLTQVTEQDGSIAGFGYDANGRLISEVRTGANPFTISHTYDAVGNRTQMTRSGAPTAFTYDGNDRLQSDGAATYAYDANGNLVTRTSGASVTQFGYDAENQLVTVQGGGLVNQYAYDADGNRVMASSAAQTVRYLVDSANNTDLAQVLEERDGGNNLLARYTYGTDLLAMTRGGSASFHHSDAQGSIRALTNNAGAISDSYLYDAYGNAVATTGSTTNPYRYSGERFDADTALYQLRARYFNPALGRFASRDPVAGRLPAPMSLHPYLYGNADPVNNSDPTGRESLISINVAQAISSGLDVAYSFGVAIVQGCNLKERLDVAGNLLMWGSLAAGALAIIGGTTGFPAKTAFSVFGVNPIPLGAKKVKSIDFRVEAPLNLKVIISPVRGPATNFAYGLDGFSFGQSLSQPLYPIDKCGLPVGSVNLKGGLKGSGASGGSLTFSVSGEINLLNVFRYEYPVLELGGSDEGGLTKDKAFGADLLPKLK